MAKMLRNTPWGRWRVCPCRQCRGNDRNRDDSKARRAQRSRERQEWHREAEAES